MNKIQLCSDDVLEKAVLVAARNGYGDGEGDGYAECDGSGEGWGYGNGYGSGEGWGYGNGYGDGAANGYGIG